MQVLGDLIKLPNNTDWLPLPWWQRAPLGLLHGTDVHVGLVKGSRPVGDIVVSALDINKWQNMLRLDCTHEEERGVLALLMDAVLPLNIALAETVTTEMGREHHATLFCEDKGILQIKDAVVKIQHALKGSGFRDINLQPYLSTSRLPMLASCRTRIDHGWLKRVPFTSWIEKHYDETSRQMIDLQQAVVSADTESRLLRFVFPLRGAKTVKVKHTDRPGALRSIFNEFLACELNVLSALLRRGGQQSGYAELIAISEPKAGQNPLEVYEQFRVRIGNIAPEFDPTTHLADARAADDVIYLPPAKHVTPPGRRPLFFAIRDAEHWQRDSSMNKIVRKLLYEQRWWLLEAVGNSTGISNHSKETFSLMERGDAAVFLITGFARTDAELFRLNLVHELGYLAALGKPILIIAGTAEAGLFERWTTLSQATQVALIHDPPLPNGDPASLSFIVREWSTKAWAEE